MSLAWIITALVLLGVAVYASMLVKQLRLRAAGLPPGPPALPIIENSGLILFGDPVVNLSGLHPKYGATYTIWIAGRPVVVLGDPADFAQMAKNDQFTFRNGVSESGLKRVGMFEAGVVMNNHPTKWKKFRGLFLGSVNSGSFLGFAGSNLSDVFDSRYLQKFDEFAESGAPMTMKPVLQEWISANFSQTLFGTKLGLGTDYAKTALLVDGFFDAWNFYLYTPEYFYPFLRSVMKEMNAKLDEIFTWERELIKARVISKDEDGEKDFIKTLLAYQKEMQEKNPGEPPITLEDIRSAVNELIGGGVDTSVNVSSNMFYLLSRAPEVQKRIRDEVRECVKANGGQFDSKLITKLPYLSACFLEGIRFTTPIPFVLRQASQDVQLEKYKVPAGTLVGMHIHQMHRNPEIFPDPDRYNPDRFLENPALESRIIAFGLGKRSCPGQSLGHTIVKVMVAKLLMRYSMEPVNPKRVLSGKLHIVYAIDSECTDMILKKW